MKRYFKGIQPHINIEKIEAEIAFFAWSTGESFGELEILNPKHQILNNTKIQNPKRKVCFDFRV
jgi:CxxC motif-containing protein